MATRREFIQKTAFGAAGLTLGAKSYSRIPGANDRVRVGIVGFSDRFRSSLAPAFLSQAKELNFEIVAVSDPMTNTHMRNWMECVRDRKKPNAGIMAGYNHSIAYIMCTAALRTGEKASFDEAKQEVLAGGKVFQY
jgi:hypothetical protein